METYLAYLEQGETSPAVSHFMWRQPWVFQPFRTLPLEVSTVDYF